MSIVNRRNAVVGWAAWNVGKRKARKRAAAVGPKIGSAVGALVAAGGALALWRKLRRGGDDSSV